MISHDNSIVPKVLDPTTIISEIFETSCNNIVSLYEHHNISQSDILYRLDTMIFIITFPSQFKNRRYNIAINKHLITSMYKIINTTTKNDYIMWTPSTHKYYSKNKRNVIKHVHILLNKQLNKDILFVLYDYID